jgi:hypothetical protein
VAIRRGMMSERRKPNRDLEGNREGWTFWVRGGGISQFGKGTVSGSTGREMKAAESVGRRLSIG